jgi:hypothetical protein
MRRITFTGILLSAALLAPSIVSAQISCARGGLQRAVELYIAAQTSGDPSTLPLAAGLGYIENMASADINTGMLSKPLKIDHHFSLLDTESCQTFTEVIVTDENNPHVLGTRLRLTPSSSVARSRRACTRGCTPPSRICHDRRAMSWPGPSPTSSSFAST